MARYLYMRSKAPCASGPERRARTRFRRAARRTNKEDMLMTTAKDVLKTIKDKDIKYVDLRFTDPRGKWQHVTFDIALIDEDIFTDGTMFDGSSIAGWKAINESDMMLMPDPATACMDPFFSASTMSIVCDILEP